MKLKQAVNMKFLIFIFLTIPMWFLCQETSKVKFTIEKGRFIFDKESYLLHKKQSEEIAESQRKADSISKADPKVHINFIDDRILEYPRFDSATVAFRNKILENIKLDNVKFGQNIMSIVIDKYGKVKKFKCLKIADRKICDQINKMVVKKDFDRWKPAIFYGTIVEYDFRFSIIIDSNLANYDLKNKWSQESNLQDFIK